jgi:hypothetical protein
MFLNYASYFGEPEVGLQSVVDFLLSERLGDGGFNCRAGAHHSSLHTTLSVLEGILEYRSNGYRYRLDELQRAAASSREFILQHRFYKSDHTGAVIRPEMLQFRFPARWKYNVLRALDYFRSAGAAWDERMSDALGLVISKRRPDGRWSQPGAHPGQVHFTMEAAGQPGRWNSLVARRVLKTYGHQHEIVRS